MASIIRQPPEGIGQCRERMTQLLAECRALAGGAEASSPLPWKRVLLAGFSLGAITALDIAITRPQGEDVAGVLAMNGAPICVEEWAKGLAVHPGLRVYLSAGQQDTTLPSEAMGWVKQLLDANGGQVLPHAARLVTVEQYATACECLHHRSVSQVETWPTDQPVITLQPRRKLLFFCPK